MTTGQLNSWHHKLLLHQIVGLSHFSHQLAEVGPEQVWEIHKSNRLVQSTVWQFYVPVWQSGAYMLWALTVTPLTHALVQQCDSLVQEVWQFLGHSPHHSVWESCNRKPRLFSIIRQSTDQRLHSPNPSNTSLSLSWLLGARRNQYL